MGRIRLGNKPPLTVRAGDSVQSAARAMTERQVGAAAVLDENSHVLGVVTERDVLQKVVAAGVDPASTWVADIMSSPARCVDLDTTVDQAAAIMREHHIRHLVVLDANGRMVGMLALRYLLYDLMDDMQRNVGDLLGYIMTDGPGG